jgi:hypothetical protein
VALFAFYGLTALLCGIAAIFRTPRMPRFWPLLVLAATPQLALIFGVKIPGALVVAAFGLTCWGLANWRIPGLPLVVGGMLLNMLAMFAHGGRMPIHADVLARLGHEVAAGDILLGSKDVVVDFSPLLWLSDRFIVGNGQLALIFSVGDILLLLGLLWWILFSQAPQRSFPHDSTAYQPGTESGPPPISPRS